VGFRALVVDDDEMNLLLVQRVLEGRGIAVEVARDGMSALAALERLRPDLVILDIMMPGISGAEVLDRIKANPALATIPVIMLTAKADDGDLIESYRSGADYYVTKPLVPSQLLYGVGLILGSDFRSDPDRAAKTDRTRSGPRLVRPRQ
jgi:CheY-like chemotaxis protein